MCSDFWCARLEEFTHTAPTDLVWTNGLGISSLTCRGCYPGDIHSNARFSKGGSENVINYTKEMIIEFSEPVADLEWQIMGARTVTDNRGYTVNMNPLLNADGGPIQAIVAKFPGSGITRLTISPDRHRCGFQSCPVAADALCLSCLDAGKLRRN